MIYIVSMELISKSTHHHLYKQKTPLMGGASNYTTSSFFILLVYFVTDFLYRIIASVIEPNKNPGMI